MGTRCILTRLTCTMMDRVPRAPRVAAVRVEFGRGECPTLRFSPDGVGLLAFCLPLAGGSGMHKGIGIGLIAENLFTSSVR